MSRIYKVKVLNEEVLVRAETRGSAIRHAMEKSVEVEVASQDDLVRLTGKGVVVSDAAKRAVLA